jgi:hypothetical protein
MPADFDYRPAPTSLERDAFNGQPVPGEIFTRNPTAKQQGEQWTRCPDFALNDGAEGSTTWWWTGGGSTTTTTAGTTRAGHLYYLAEEGDPDDRPGRRSRSFFRAQHGQILNLTLANRLPPEIEGTPFDPPFPPLPGAARGRASARCTSTWSSSTHQRRRPPAWAGTT